MHQPRKNTPKPSKAEQKSDQQMMRDFAKCIVEALTDTSQNIKDPFEYYAHQLRRQWYKDEEIFCSRFIQGYDVLIEHLHKKNLPDSHPTS